MCKQQDLITEALHEAVDECSTFRIESEVLRRTGPIDSYERANAVAARLSLLCAALQDLLALHRSEHGC